MLLPCSGNAHPMLRSVQGCSYYEHFFSFVYPLPLRLLLLPLIFNVSWGGRASLTWQPWCGIHQRRRLGAPQILQLSGAHRRQNPGAGPWLAHPPHLLGHPGSGWERGGSGSVQPSRERLRAPSLFTHFLVTGPLAKRFPGTQTGK